MYTRVAKLLQVHNCGRHVDRQVSEAIQLIEVVTQPLSVSYEFVRDMSGRIIVVQLHRSSNVEQAEWRCLRQKISVSSTRRGLSRALAANAGSHAGSPVQLSEQTSHNSARLTRIFSSILSQCYLSEKCHIGA